MGTGQQQAPAQTPEQASPAPAQAPSQEGDAQSTQGNAAVQEQTPQQATGGGGIAQPQTAHRGGDEEGAEEPTLLEEFQAALEADDADAASVLAWAAWLGGSHPDVVEQILSDATVREATFGLMGSEADMVTLMLYFHVGTGTTPRSLADGVKWVDGATGLSNTGWARLVAGKTAEECLGVIDDPAALGVMSGVDGDPVQLFPALDHDPIALRQAVLHNDAYWNWIGDVGGGERQLQIIDFIVEVGGHEDQRQQMVDAGTWAEFVDNLPAGPTTGDDGARLWHWFLCETDVVLMRKLFEKRFAVELSPENTETHTVEAGETLWGIAAHYYGDPARWEDIYDANQGVIGDDPNLIEPGQRLELLFIHEWDHESIKRTWLIADQLPPGDIADNALIFRYGDSGGAGGFAGGGEIGMSWGTDQIGEQETGAFTSEDDPMRGLNVFDATMRHEIGHNVGESSGLDQPGGWAYNNYGWQEHYQKSDVRAALDAIIQTYSLDFDGLSDADAQNKRNDVLDALSEPADDTFAEEGFQGAVESYEAGLWAQIQDEPLIAHLVYLGEEGNEAWEDAEDIGGRVYHIPYDWWGIASCPPDLYNNKPSNYAMRSPMEWFAEVYATFYADADQPDGTVGTLLASRDPNLAQDFRNTVHGRHSIGQVTGQTTGAPEPATTT